MATPKVRTTGRGQTVIFDPTKKKNVLLTSKRGEQIAQEAGFSVRDLSGKSNVGFGNKAIATPDKLTRGVVSSNILSQKQLAEERTPTKKGRTTRSDFKGSQKAGTLSPTGSMLGRASAAAGVQPGQGRAGLGTIGGAGQQTTGQQFDPPGTMVGGTRASGLPASSGLLEGSVTGEQLVGADLQAQAAAEERFFGEGVSPTSIDELVSQRIEEEQRVTGALESGIGRREEAFDIQQDRARRAAGAQADQLAVAAAGEGREGPTSGSQVLAQQQIKGALGERVRLFQLERDDLNADVANLRVQQQQAIDAGRADLARNLENQIAQKSLEIRQADTNYINALGAQAQEERAAKKEGMDNISSLIDFLGPAGVAGLETETLKGVFTSAGLPGSMAVALQDAQRAVAEAAASEDSIGLEQAQADLDMTLKQIEELGKTPQQKNQEFLNEMRENGMSEEAIKEFKIQMGVAEIPDSFADFSGSTSGEGVPGTGSTVNSSVGEGQVTAYGSRLWSPGLDYKLSEGMGAEVIMPFNFEVIELSDDDCQVQASGTITGCNGGFGKQAKIRNTNDGREVWISHLASFGNLQPGQIYDKGTILGTQGNTGDTIGPTGVHLDITMPDENGSLSHKGKNYLTPQQVASYFSVGDTGPGEYTAAQKELMSSLDPKDLSKEDKATLAENGLTTNDMFEYITSNYKELDTGTREQVEDIVGIIESLKDAKGKSGAVGASFQKLIKGLPFTGEGEFISGTPAADFRADFDTLISRLSLPNLDKLKGAMSDKDIEFLQSAASSLSLDMSEDKFDETLLGLEDKYNQMLSLGTDISSEEVGTEEDVINKYTDDSKKDDFYNEYL